MSDKPESLPADAHADMHPDALAISYAVSVRARTTSVCEIKGTVELPYALAADSRPDTGANFVRLMEMLLLRPALMQVSGYVNGLRRAEFAPEEIAPEPVPKQPIAETTDPLAPPNLAPELPAKVITA